MPHPKDNLSTLIFYQVTSTLSKSMLLSQIFASPVLRFSAAILSRSLWTRRMRISFLTSVKKAFCVEFCNFLSCCYNSLLKVRFSRFISSVGGGSLLFSYRILVECVSFPRRAFHFILVYGMQRSLIVILTGPSVYFLS